MPKEIRKKDKVIGEFLSSLSAIGNISVPVKRRMGLDVGVRWMMNAEPASFIGTEIAAGYPKAGRTPKNYPGLAVLSINAEHVIEQDHDIRQAAMYGLGTVSMVGVDRDPGAPLFDYDDELGLYSIGMRIGKGPLTASIGALSVDGVYLPYRADLVKVELYDPGAVRPNVRII